MKFFEPQLFYIRISPNKLNCRNIYLGKEQEATAAIPFTTQRLLIGNFTEAEKLVSKLVKETKRFSLMLPIFIMHPLEMCEGGLSQIEERVLLELAMNTGARKPKIYLGSELSDNSAKEYAKAV